MFPHPPKLLDGKGVTDDEPGETYWKVANGIRLTGMPSFHQSLSETEMWQVSLLAAHADKLPQAAKDALSAPPFAGQPEQCARQRWLGLHHSQKHVDVRSV
jgi:mono/diheme cytochrome c family protein